MPSHGGPMTERECTRWRGAGRGRLVGLLAAVGVLLAAVSGVALAARERSGDAPRTPAVPLGAYLGVGQDGVDAVAGFERWLQTPVTVGRTYLPGHTWADVEGPDSILRPWSAWQSARPERLLVLNVPMLVPNEPPLDDRRVADLLRAGADGAFDRHFRALAERLVGHGAGDTIIVLGWEMNGTTYTSRCGPNPLAWKQYWRRIVAAMRGVDGQAFRFDFAPVRGAQAVAWPDCYPGDDVVDIIGMDSYDTGPGQTFADYLNQPYGLRAHARFAEAHGKPMSYPEWGLFDHGDNSAYVRAMHAWMTTHNVAYQTITDYCPHGVWRCSAHPASQHAFQQLFGLTPASGRPGR